MKSSLVILGLFLAAFIVGIAFVWPQYQEFSEVRRQAEIKIEELETFQQYHAKLRMLDEELADYAKEISIIDEALPDDSSLPALYDLFQDITATSGLVLNNLSISENSSASATGPNVSLAQASLAVKGSYEAFKGFLGSLRKSWRILEPTSMSFSSGTGGIFEFSLHVSVFSY